MNHIGGGLLVSSGPQRLHRVCSKAFTVYRGTRSVRACQRKVVKLCKKCVYFAKLLGGKLHLQNHAEDE